MTVPDKLRDLAKLFETRAKTYGDQYKVIGDVLWSIFNGSVKLETAQDYTRFVTLAFVLQKLCRYANNFEDGGHADSLDDASVYAQMLRQIDGDHFGE
jgi:hypothetical protein